MQAEEGEVLFYPRDYWHQTENLDNPTVAVTGTLVDQNNYDSVSQQLAVDCHKDKIHLINPSAELCEYYYTQCFPWWKMAFGDAEAHFIHVNNATVQRPRSTFSIVNRRDFPTATKSEAIGTEIPGEFSCSATGGFAEEERDEGQWNEDDFYG